MKRLILCMVALMSMSMAIAQQQIHHTIQRGETLESIAKKHGISTESLKRANPEAVEMFIVGMKLIIPQTNEEQTTIVTDRVGTRELQPKTPDTNVNDSRYTRIEKELFAGLSLNSFTGKDVNGVDMKIGFHAGLAMRYFFINHFFAEARLAFATKGYKMKNNSTSGNTWNDYGANYDSNVETTMNTFNIDLPINIGYKFHIGNNSAIRVKAGPYLTYAFSGEQKTKGRITYYPDIHSSEAENINESTKLGNIKNFNKFSFGVDAGLGVEFHKVSLMATYQRGLSSLFKNQKVYEQNILITIGYIFKK